jgi:DNA-binding response OmpR family regulator
MSGGVCIHCQAARDEIAELRRALGLSGRMTEQRLIERRFALTRSQARICQALYDAAGRVVPKVTLTDFCLGEDTDPETVKVHICRIRVKLGASAIDTAEGGWSMTPPGRALVYTALKIPEATWAPN